MIQLETERLILRDYRPEDQEDYIRLKSDPETMYYLQDIRFHSRWEGEKDFAKVLADAASSERRFVFLRAERKDTGEQLGSVGYTVESRTPLGKLVGAGYFYLPKFWGQGYGSEAFWRVLEFAFLEDDVYRVTTGCLQENKGSERVMQKCGMKKEAERPCWEWHDGAMKARVEYRLLRQEFQLEAEKRRNMAVSEHPAVFRQY